MLGGYKGKFKGLYHVYTDNGKRNIEEFYFDSFEDILLSKDITRGHSMADEFNDGMYYEQFLELEEILTNKSEEFYFEIIGEMEINFFSSSWEYSNEVDSEFELPLYKIALVDEKLALEIGGFNDKKS
jgi:hypothetical protein